MYKKYKIKIENFPVFCFLYVMVIFSVCLIRKIKETSMDTEHVI